MDETVAPDFAGTNEGLVAMLEAASKGDAVGAADGLRQMTEVNRENVVVVMLALAVLISAVGKFIERLIVPAKPFIEVAARKWEAGAEKPGE